MSRCVDEADNDDIVTVVVAFPAFSNALTFAFTVGDLVGNVPDCRCNGRSDDEDDDFDDEGGVVAGAASVAHAHSAFGSSPGPCMHVHDATYSI